jgi:hypothetical protein
MDSVDNFGVASGDEFDFMEQRDRAEWQQSVFSQSSQCRCRGLRVIDLSDKVGKSILKVKGSVFVSEVIEGNGLHSRILSHLDGLQNWFTRSNSHRILNMPLFLLSLLPPGNE